MSAPLRVLAISNLFPPHLLGGAEILCEQVCAALRARGNDVEVLTSDHLAGGAPGGDPSWVRRELALYQPFSQPGRILRGARLRVGAQNRARTVARIRAFKPQVIFFWSLRRLTVGPARAAQAAGVPSLYVINDENLASYAAAPFSLSPRKLAAWALDRTLARSTTCLGLDLGNSASISRDVKQALVGRGVPVEGSQVVYQGVPLDRFPCKERPGRIGAAPRALFAGQLLRSKGVHTLIEAVHRLNASEALPLTIAGEGPDGPWLRALAAAGPARIDFVGRLPHEALSRLYREHDLFVFPSEREPFGLTNLEAMASGTPVISTSEGGHGEMVRDGVNALVFPRGDAAALAACLARLLHEPALAESLARTARAQVERDYSLEGYVSALERILRETASAS